MNKALFFIFCVIVFPVVSQVGPGTWKDHQGLSSCYGVTRNGSTIYASYINGLVKFDEKELSPEPLNKINGLSDLPIRLVRTNAYNNKVLVIYDNCNIDVIDINGNIKNYPDIKLKALTAKKIINEVTFEKQFAYLACGFGIIVFDMDKLEIKDTYIIGQNASYLEVTQLALGDSLIFAATPIGMYRANRSTALNNYNNWKYDTINIAKGVFCGVQNVQGNVISCYCPSSVDPADAGKDTVYTYVNSGWKKYPPFGNTGYTIRKMGPSYENLFSIVDPIGLQVRNAFTGNLVQHITNYNGEIDYGTYRDAFIGKDHSGNIAYWLADARFGLNRTYQYYDPMTKITRNGMNKPTIGNVDIVKGKVAVSPSFIDETGHGNYSREGINILKDGEWTYIKCNDPTGTVLQDITSVLIDRQDTSKMWISTWFYGVLLYKNNKLTNSVYTSTNSGLSQIAVNEPRCAGLSMDANGNVWFASSDQKNYLNVIKKDLSCLSFSFNVSHGFARKTFVDKNNYVYVLHERNGGLTVFNHQNFNQPVENVNYKWLNSSPGTGNLESNVVYSIAEDRDGKIWLGTGAGIKVLYNPTAIFSGGNYDAQPIKIVQDGNVELLLNKEGVRCITIDGANNKWCGTSNGGVYCFSPDGLKQLHHFTQENSPLFSNTILDINYDATTGDIFFATEMGLQSYRGIVVAGEETYSDVHAYPNPVRPGYQGNVLIRGLRDDSIVKITDQSGNLVWETKSYGGQIEWSISNFSNTRVSPGVYIIYATTTTGEYKAVTKVLVVN